VSLEEGYEEGGCPACTEDQEVYLLHDCVVGIMQYSRSIANEVRLARLAHSNVASSHLHMLRFFTCSAPASLGPSLPKGSGTS
jgi:hypothetical protein